MHSSVDSPGPLHTQLQNLFLLLRPKILDSSSMLAILLTPFVGFLTTLQLRASLYLYNPMVCRPWVGLHYIQNLGQTIYDSNIQFTLHAHNSRRFYNNITQNVMKPAHKKMENIDQRLRIQPLRGGNILYIT